MCLLISCDVGGDRFPAALTAAQTISLERGTSPSCDIAAAYVAQRLATGFDAPLITNAFSPALIDVGRSLHHRELFPKWTRKWPEPDRQLLVDEIYRPYRESVRRAIAGGLLRHSYVIHLSIRTFALRTKGTIRRTDVGLLYDPSNDHEVDLCLDWIDEMYDEAPMLRVRRNYPRRGTNDSITKSMRAEFAGTPYLGIEVMLNRAWVSRDVSLRDEAIEGIIGGLKSITQTPQREAA
ncbi:N-formylglutamate amidohydrolase [Rubripirellula tenax]|uniref:N-formylglutamate amidohydrolase n=1 Tax=Rubripirellula tenax TaxID=2528015 RepID=A0A5C6FMK1_9BACT|nr:N-formylglutamate amidohydrolase [Rubripirellula tenax]TWU60732.1 N-formylglutamate amidohydrolase [Rubripirellula tenax]